MKINFWKLGLALVFSAYFFHYALNPGAGDIIDNANLIFHEAGHFIFSIFGQTVMVLGGSLMQVIIPLVCVGYFFYSKQPFSAALVMLWVGQNIINISVYAGDAQVRVLPLLTGDPATHDWHYIFGVFGLLPQTKTIAAVIYFIGVAVLILAAVLAVRFSFSRERKRSDFIV